MRTSNILALASEVSVSVAGVGSYHDGDLVASLWIGAGNGAMNGYSAMVL